MKSKPQTTPTAGKPKAAGREPVTIEAGADSITIRITGRAFRNLTRIADAMERAEAGRVAAAMGLCGKSTDKATGGGVTPLSLVEYICEDLRMLAYAEGAKMLLADLEAKSRAAALSRMTWQPMPSIPDAEG